MLRGCRWSPPSAPCVSVPPSRLSQGTDAPCARFPPPSVRATHQASSRVWVRMVAASTAQRPRSAWGSRDVISARDGRRRGVHHRVVSRNATVRDSALALSILRATGPCPSSFRFVQLPMVPSRMPLSHCPLPSLAASRHGVSQLAASASLRPRSTVTTSSAGGHYPERQCGPTRMFSGATPRLPLPIDCDARGCRFAFDLLLPGRSARHHCATIHCCQRVTSARPHALTIHP